MTATEASAPALLLPTDLLGWWDLHRTVHDRLGGVSGTVTGSTELTAEDDGSVRWHEAGTMVLGATETPVWRTLSVRRGTGDRWYVHFADGRPFHDWAWGDRVEHACAPDDYTGLLTGTLERWRVRWEARGPAKDLVLDSVLTPTR
ncbi:DUF6314 family protein [Curtobacterium sp. MCBD17_008]|uniref:DUF6314 family protein n=1 Tax=Curtobacterium sp. MCBD17_008 TaxID=2175656 RepID=UPI000DAA8331|nr:DUF6314 family protein [Curtobacterium sp. MCBD17_008]PZE88378.1 hypothetical protein DEI95_15510 [Curtobacterium sp. MCBD17_008]